MGKLLVVLCLVVGWLGLVSAGLVSAARYDSKPAPVRATTPAFPGGGAISLAKDRPTIVLFAHPECPCTKATLHQLEEAQAKATRKASIYIVFATPEGLPVGDGSQVLIKQARQIKGATVIEDDGLALAKRFGATTSGQTFVFDPGSTLLFKGGLTRARGHYGNSLGAESLLSMMDTGKPVATETPVYGCSLGL